MAYDDAMKIFASSMAACAFVVAGLHGVSQHDQSSARAAAAALPRLHSLVVSHRGQTTFEYYAQGHGPTRLANIKSASKSVISTLVGIAIARS